MYDFIIFDVDGTLIDTGNAVMKSYQKAIVAEFGRRFTEEELSPVYGIPTKQAIELLGFKDVEAGSNLYFKYLFEAFTKVKPFKGIVELLEELKARKVGSGVVTSRNRLEVANDPSLQSLLKYFGHVVCTEDTPKHKPEAEPALKLIEKAGADISKAIYLGDTYYDYMCAKNAGVKFALASWGARDISDIQADYVLKEPKDLLDLVWVC